MLCSNNSKSRTENLLDSVPHVFACLFGLARTWQQLLVIQNPLDALIPNRPHFHLLKVVFCICAAVYGLNVCDLFLCVTCDVFQDHFKMRRISFIFIILVCVLIPIVTAMNNWLHCWYTINNDFMIAEHRSLWEFLTTVELFRTPVSTNILVLHSVKLKHDFWKHKYHTNFTEW